MDQRFLEIPDAADVSAFLWINIRNLIAMRTQDLEGAHAKLRCQWGWWVDLFHDFEVKSQAQWLQYPYNYVHMFPYDIWEFLLKFTKKRGIPMDPTSPFFLREPPEAPDQQAPNP